MAFVHVMGPKSLFSKISFLPPRELFFLRTLCFNASAFLRPEYKREKTEKKIKKEKRKKDKKKNIKKKREREKKKGKKKKDKR